MVARKRIQYRVTSQAVVRILEAAWLTCARGPPRALFMAMDARENRFVAIAMMVPLLALFVVMVHTVIIPVALGGLFAVILFPLLRPLQQRLGPLKGTSVPILMMATVLFMLVPVAFVALMGLRTVQHLAAGHFGDLRKTVGETVNQQAERMALVAQGMGVHLETEELRANVTDVAQDAIRSVASHVGDMAAVAPQLLVSLFLLLFALYFFLRDGPRMINWVGTVVPFSGDETLELFGSVRQAIRGVVLSSMLVGLLQSALCLLIMLIFSVPGAFVWSVMAFVLSFLPMVGTTPVTLGCVVYLALGDRFWAAALMAAAAVFIGTIDNLIRPLAQGTQSKMHPLLTLMAIFGGLETLGPAGIFLGPVVAAMALWGVETYAEWREHRITI